MRQGFGPYVETGPYLTRTGRSVTEYDLAEWVAEAERGYDLETLRNNRVPFTPAGEMREDTVESESSPGTYYHLKRRLDGSWWCDCPGYQYRQECKHSRRKQEEKPW